MGSFISLYSNCIHLNKNWIEDKINAYIARKIARENNTDSDRELIGQVYYGMKFICVFLIKLVITVPTLAAISILSSARMEDIIALNDAHIPSVGLAENITQWSNNTPGLWIVLLLMAVYYLKFLFYIKGDYFIGHLPDGIQQSSYHNNPQYRNSLDRRIAFGYNRRFIQGLLGMVIKFLPFATIHQNFHEVEAETVGNGANETDENGKPKKQLFDFMFLDSEDSLYRSSPALALQVNCHREALYLTLFVGLIATTVLSFTYVLYFLILWIVQLAYRIGREYVFAKKYWGNHLRDFSPLRLARLVWITDLICFTTMAMLLWILTPSYTPKSIAAVAEVKKALPDNFSGLYFVPKADGEKVKGVTARIIQDETGNYFLQVYSDRPMRRFDLKLDEEAGIFHNDILGDGYITYDEQTKSININFSDLWILTN